MNDAEHFKNITEKYIKYLRSPLPEFAEKIRSLIQLHLKDNEYAHAQFEHDFEEFYKIYATKTLLDETMFDMLKIGKQIFYVYSKYRTIEYIKKIFPSVDYTCLIDYLLISDSPNLSNSIISGI